MTKATKYGWAAGSQLAHLDPQPIGEHLARLQALKPLRPEQIVEDAKKRKSPLHDCFEWDDERAAFRHRIEQARHLIGRLVEVTITKGVETDTKAFYNVRIVTDKTATQGYVTADVAMSDAALRRQLLNRALGEAKSWRERYDELKELSTIRTEIDKVIAAQNAASPAGNSAR